MLLKRWSPFIDSDFRFVTPWVDRFFGEVGNGFTWRPFTDMYKENGDLVVKAELPGIDPEKDLKISIEADVLVIHGEKTVEKEVTEKDRYLMERSFGNFDRRIPLPEGVDPNKLSAQYEKGVLTVKVPLPTQVEPTKKQIPVMVK
jgi:HSP20 family protein